MALRLPLIAGLVLALALPVAADAAIIEVNSQADDDGDGCTLREAITSANSAVPPVGDGCTDGDGDDDIVLADSPDSYELFTPGDGEDNNATGDLDVKGNVLIRGAGIGSTVIDANGIDRVFHTITGTVELRDLTITRGHAPDGGPGSPGVDDPGNNTPSIGNVGIPGEEGGGIYNQTALTLTRVRVFGNVAGAGGAGGVGQTAGNGSPGQSGAESKGGIGGDGGEGGGIFSQVGGSLTITESKIDHNSAGEGGKGGNAGEGGSGGSGTIGVVGGDSTGGQGGLGGSGGGVDSIGGALNISSSEISDNFAGASGPGGNGGQAGTGGLGTSGSGGTGGKSTGGGSKQGGFGGGIRANGASFGFVENTIRGNTAGTGGGGGNGGTGGTGGPGTSQGAGGDSIGGLGGDGGWGGGMATNTSTINNNPMNAVAIVQNVAGSGGAGGSQGTAGTGSAPGFAAGGDGGLGGNAGGATINDDATSLTDSTVGENQSGDGGASGGGGGVAGFHGTDAGIQVGSGTTNLTHVTVAGNTFGTGSLIVSTGGVAERFTGDVRLYNTLVAGNAGDECSPGLTDGTPGFNLSFPADGLCPATFVHGDPKLGPVQDNTGTTPTMALLAGSAAVNTADPGSCTGTDQRGVARPKGAGCDIGAFERSPPSAATGAASQLTTTTARVAGTGNMGTLPGSHRFRFGQTTAYGRTTPAVPTFRGQSTISSTPTLTGLKPNTLYHYRFVTTNADATALGIDRTFKTPQVPFAGVGIPANQSRAINDNRVARVGVRCPAVAVGPCKGTLALKKKFALEPGGEKKTRTLGTKQFTIPRGQLVRLKVKIKQAIVDAIEERDNRRLKANARASATDARGGAPKVTRRQVTLRVP